MKLENYIFGPCLIKIKVEKEDLEKIKFLCGGSSKKNWNNALIGAFKKEYRLDNDSYNEITKKYHLSFQKATNKFYGFNKPKLKASSVWVNYMVKGDYSPPHMHNDCAFSTVMILQSPADLKKETEENNYYSDSSLTSGPGCLEFNYGIINNNFNISIRSFFPEEGDFFLFPSWLTHWVNPFKCEGERITVASNLIYFND